MPRFASLVVFLSFFFLSLPPVSAQRAKVVAKARTQKAFKRDLKRMKRVKEVKDLDALLKSNSRLTGQLKGAVHGTFMNGTNTIDLGKQLKLEVRATKHDLPIATVVKLNELRLNSNGKSVSLMPDESVPVNIKGDTTYNFERNMISWQGPQSRFALMTFLHEQGHAKDFKSASPERLKEFHSVYNKIAQEKKLTDGEHRQLIGLERSAWAHALRTARALKKQGFNILDGVSVREVSDAISANLKGYYAYAGTAP